MTTHSHLIFKVTTIISILFASASSIADDKVQLQKASEAACGKIKMCIKKQATEEGDISPEMLKMIDKIAENSCKSLYEINEVTAYDNLVEPISKCYEAMANSSCADLVDGKQPQACIDLEKEVEKM